MLNEPCNCTLWNAGYFFFQWALRIQRIIAKIERNSNYGIPMLSEFFFFASPRYVWFHTIHSSQGWAIVHSAY